MLEWSQVQAIVDKLAGTETQPPRPGDLDHPWDAIYSRIAQAGPSDWERELWKATEGRPNRYALMDRLEHALPTHRSRQRYPSLQTISRDLEPVDWLWPSWIPRGMLTLLGASPGAGKSLVALDLARRLIHGDPWPDGTSVATPGGNVVFVDAEALPQVQSARAKAWNMDGDRLFPLMPDDTSTLIDFGSPADQDNLTEMVHHLDPELVIVDSLSSVTLQGENNVEDVRELLGFLSSVARDFDVALLLIHHLRKRHKGRAPVSRLISADDFRGSSHIIARARSVIALSLLQRGPEPDRNGPRRLEIVKTNLCRYPEPLGLRFIAGDHDLAPFLRYSPSPPPRRRSIPTWRD